VRTVLLAALLAVAACSPEATRDRGEPGADPGNRTPVLDMHGDTDPAHDTPEIGKAVKTQ
jgi:hypothetical protein